MKVKLLRKLNKLISIYYFPSQGIYKLEVVRSHIDEFFEPSTDLEYLKRRRRRALLAYTRKNYWAYRKKIKIV